MQIQSYALHLSSYTLVCVHLSGNVQRFQRKDEPLGQSSEKVGGDSKDRAEREKAEADAGPQAPLSLGPGTQGLTSSVHQSHRFTDPARSFFLVLRPSYAAPTRYRAKSWSLRHNLFPKEFTI